MEVCSGTSVLVFCFGLGRIDLMLPRSLPPVGSPVALSNPSADVPSFAGYQAVWLDSGTAALALALIACREKHLSAERPQVILPAYGCPDLVAAAECAGVTPVLVDVQADDPGYDLTALRSALCSDTIAVVAVNFLGIRERMVELRELLMPWPRATLIEDNAQWFPEPKDELESEAICLSFGRGKPVNLIGGGALLVRGSFTSADLRRPIGPAKESRMWMRSKARLFNALLNPVAYWIASRVPFFGVGKTVFQPLHEISELDHERMRLLEDNVRRHFARSQKIAERIRQCLPPAMDLPSRLSGRAGRLLRYPVLCVDKSQRDRLWQALARAGLGASTMYERSLIRIDGVDSRVASCVSSAGADCFADRLLTLPVHPGVEEQSIQRLESIIEEEMLTARRPAEAAIKKSARPDQGV